MPAAQFQLIVEEGANIAYEFVYRDANGNAEDVTNYGATVVFVDGGGRLLYLGDNVDGVVQIGSSDGKIILNVPISVHNNWNVEEGFYQLYIYSTSGDPTDNPLRLVEGSFIYSKSFLYATT